MTMTKIKLGDVLDVKRGASLSGDYYAKTGTLIRLTLGNFNYPGGGFKDNTAKDNTYYTNKVRSEFILKKGEIITPLTEQVRGLLGETARIPVSNLYIQSQDVGKIIPNENNLDKNFAYYLISSPIVKYQLDAGAQQTKIRHTSPDKIKDCVAWIPDISSQKKIATLLDFLNTKISNNNKINAELESMVKTLYNYWFLQFEFPNEEGKPYTSSGGKMIWNEELKREIPEGWEVKKLSEILMKVNRLFDYDVESRTYDLSIIPSNSIVINDTSSSKKFETNLFSLKKGDLLFGSIRPYLRKAGIASYDGAVAGTIHCYEVRNEYDYNLALLTLSSENLFKYAINNSKGTKMPVVSSDDLLEFLIPYNGNVVKKFNKLSIKDMIIANVHQSNELSSLRDFLLPLLMNGQVTFR